MHPHFLFLTCIAVAVPAKMFFQKAFAGNAHDRLKYMLGHEDWIDIRRMTSTLALCRQQDD